MNNINWVRWGSVIGMFSCVHCHICMGKHVCYVGGLHLSPLVWPPFSLNRDSPIVMQTHMWLHTVHTNRHTHAYTTSTVCSPNWFPNCVNALLLALLLLKSLQGVWAFAHSQHHKTSYLQRIEIPVNYFWCIWPFPESKTRYGSDVGQLGKLGFTFGRDTINWEEPQHWWGWITPTVIQRKQGFTVCLKCSCMFCCGGCEWLVFKQWWMIKANTSAAYCFKESL